MFEKSRMVLNMKHLITYFVSYAHKDETLPEKLLTFLRPHLALSPKYVFAEWMDKKVIRVGEEWHEKVQDALEFCDIALLLISPNFFSGTYIQEHELPVFLNYPKPIIPVMLRSVNPSTQDLKGIEKRQIFTCPNSGNPFSKCSTTPQKDNFAYQLSVAIESRLNTLNLTPSQK